MLLISHATNFVSLVQIYTSQKLRAIEYHFWSFCDFFLTMCSANQSCTKVVIWGTCISWHWMYLFFIVRPLNVISEYINPYISTQTLWGKLSGQLHSPGWPPTLNVAWRKTLHNRSEEMKTRFYYTHQTLNLFESLSCHFVTMSGNNWILFNPFFSYHIGIYGPIWRLMYFLSSDNQQKCQFHYFPPSFFCLCV